MAKDAPQQPTDATDEPPAPALRETAPLRTEAAAASAATSAESAVPPALSGSGLLRRGFTRWLVMGAVRQLYRRWTRIAAILFPEGTGRASFASAIGIPLPDRLNLSWVTDHLAVGGRVLPGDIHRLAAVGITRVVDTRAEHQDDSAALAAEHVLLLHLPAPDTHALSIAQLEQGARWINEQIAQGQRVLVHCEHGVGRSVLLTAAALVASGMSAHDAIRLIQRKRWQAAPNHRQIQRLQEFERAARAGEGAHA